MAFLVWHWKKVKREQANTDETFVELSVVLVVLSSSLADLILTRSLWKVNFYAPLTEVETKA